MRGKRGLCNSRKTEQAYSFADVKNTSVYSKTCLFLKKEHNLIHLCETNHSRNYDTYGKR